MKLLALTFALAIPLAAACKDAPEQPTATAGIDGATDNTRLNVRDRGSNATPINQGNGQSDIDITAAIRKTLIADDRLSSDAKNAKVITQGGRVVLRGPVKSDEEKAAVGAKAIVVVGADHVENDLDITK